MKHSFFVLLLSFFTLGMSAQSSTPVKWDFELVQSDNELAVKATASIDENWVVYSNYTEEGGPIPTSIDIENAELIGKVSEEGELISEMSKMFFINVSKFKNEYSLVQKIKIEEGQKEVNGYIRFMTCDGQRCLPPKNINFSLPI